MHTSLDLKRPLFPFGFSAEYKLEADMPRFQMPLIIDFSLRRLLPAAAAAGNGELSNLKGRDPAALINDAISSDDKPQCDEIFFLSGFRFVEECRSPDGSENYSMQPFALRMHTVFKEFIGAHRIVYTVQEIREGAFPEEVPTLDLGRAFPLAPRLMRVGIDLFKSRFLAAALGFTPVVSESLLLECSESSFCMQIRAEGLSEKSSLPLQHEGMLEKLNYIIGSVLNFNFVEDYKKKCLHTHQS